jgi:PadR family transcriptional regulator, regulatory protein AphA
MQMELSPTAKVILGMLAMRPRSGYEIKSFVDDSTRYFWSASYGQIYPELKRLTEAGLVEGTDSPTGGRPRTVHRITDEGRRALRDWHSAPAEIYELRDEGLLKLFLAGAVDPQRAAEIARERAALSAGIAERLREVESRAEGKDKASYAVLESGIAFHDFTAQHFEKVARDLERAHARNEKEKS